MEPTTLSFLAMIGLLAANRLVITLVGVQRWRGIFWTVQFLNLGAVISLILFGLPAMPPELRAVDYFIALLFLFHIVQNNARKAKALRESSGRREADFESRRQRVRAKLTTADGNPSPSPPTDPPQT